MSTQVSGVWTFRSGHVAGDRPARLPLLTVTFAPPVDDRHAMPSGNGVLVPVSVVAQPDSGAGPIGTLAVQVSYDDGRTWRDAPVVEAAGKRAVKLDHPAGARFVSVRAKAADSRGNAVEQTILRAYRIEG